MPHLKIVVSSEPESGRIESTCGVLRSKDAVVASILSKSTTCTKRGHSAYRRAQALHCGDHRAESGSADGRYALQSTMSMTEPRRDENADMPRESDTLAEMDNASAGGQPADTVGDGNTSGPTHESSLVAAFSDLRKTAAYAATAPTPDMLAASASRARARAMESRKSQVSAALAHARSKTALLASSRQRGNPMLRHVRHVRVEFESDAALSADFVCGPMTAVLYLSLQYHALHPKYVYDRVRALGAMYRLRVLLVLVDVDEPRRAIQELSCVAMVADLTLVCAASEREAARWCETLRSYEGKTADSIRERVANDYASRLSAALGSVRGVNKNDVTTLAFTFGSLRGVAEASQEDLRKCHGIGDKKATRLHAAFHQPFFAGDSADQQNQPK